jgi:hypothetical protein
MKNVKIENACSEKWNEMAPTEKGAFCQVCATNVIDFTNKSSLEIKQLLLANSGNSVCGRIKEQQLEQLNTEFELWQMSTKQTMQRAMIFSLLVVFGLTLFSCETEKDKQAIQALQASVSQVIETNDAKISPVVQVSQTSEAVNLPELIYIDEVRSCCKCIFDDIDKPIPLEEVVLEEYVITEERESIWLGGMGYTVSYVDFLQETVQPIEYDENGLALPTELTAKAYPNPTADFTTLEIGLPEKERAEIAVYDMSGKLLQTIHDGKIERGTSSYSIDLSSYEPGMYLITIRSKKFNETVRVSKM